MIGKIGSLLTFLLLVFMLFFSLTGSLQNLLLPTIEKYLGKSRIEDESLEKTSAIAQDYLIYLNNINQIKDKIEAKEVFLDKTEERITQKTKSLNEQQQKLGNEIAQLQKFLEERKIREDDSLEGLVKLYSKMPIEDVAPLISQMNENLALKILKKIKPGKAALILGSLKRDEAVRFSNKLAQVN